jgi:hypothetical protein
MKADGEVNVYLLAFLTSAASTISITPWPLHLQGNRPPDCTKQTVVLTLETVWMFWRREDCWKLTLDFFVIQPIAQSLYSPSIQTQIIHVRVNNKLIPQVRGTEVYQRMTYFDYIPERKKLKSSLQSISYMSRC